MMNEYDYIENYFNGILLPEEMKRFDEKIQEDPAFAEEVAFYCSAIHEIKKQGDEEKKKGFMEIYEKTRPMTSSTLVRKLWPYIAAAAVIGGIIFGLFIFTKPDSVQLADQYIQQHFQTLPVTMNSREDDMKKGLSLYNENKLPGALQQFKNIIRSDTADFTAKKNAGIVCLRLKQYDKALIYFKQLDKYTNSYSNPAKLYQALTLMKRNQPGDKKMAKQLLQQVVDNNFEGKEDATVLLKKF